MGQARLSDIEANVRAHFQSIHQPTAFRRSAFLHHLLDS